MLFYLGTSEPAWLTHANMPLFISRRRLARRVALPRAACRWALDSGGFTELSTHGRWTITPQQYAAQARTYRDEIGQMDWAASMDWMCEPVILKQTGLSLAEHQRRTVDSYVELHTLAPDVPFIPVLQGWSLPDYLNCLELYARAGVQLAQLARVGVGTLCRRQGTRQAAQILAALHQHGLRLHGFGFKMQGLVTAQHYLASADSMAWSLNARKRPPLPGCHHKSCANCLHWARRWRQRLTAQLSQAAAGPQQIAIGI